VQGKDVYFRCRHNSENFTNSSCFKKVALHICLWRWHACVLLNYCCYFSAQKLLFQSSSFFVGIWELRSGKFALLLTLSNVYFLAEVISARLETQFLYPYFRTSSHGWSVRQLLPYLETSLVFIYSLRSTSSTILISRIRYISDRKKSVLQNPLQDK